jgi:magnesium-transporting ATPase (P-type)
VLNEFYKDRTNLKKLNGTLTCDPLGADIHKVNAKFETEIDGEIQSNLKIDIDNVLLRGMMLKNTPSVVGIAIYTGHETRI